MLLHSPESSVLDDAATCSAQLRQGSKSFAAAARLLPASVRVDATALYAFCREADDAVDHGGGADAVAMLRARLDAIYAGRPGPQPCDRALTGVVARHQLPRALLDALIEGFEWDAAGRRYHTLVELHDYCARVAGTVGAMMCVLMGVRTESALARACDLGVAMQLTNIARDVGEDARAGRLYLPLDWMRDAGVDADAWLEAPVASAAVRAVVARLLDAADQLYARVADGIAELDPACRPGIRAAQWIYADIGRLVRARGCDSVGVRAIVPGRRKVWLVLCAMLPVPAPVLARHSAPPLAATRALVDAAAREPLAETPRWRWWEIGQRAVWVIDLFERLERERLGMSGVRIPQMPGH
jgi:phytoene synthase